MFGYEYCFLLTFINDPSTVKWQCVLVMRDNFLINCHLVSPYDDDEAFVFTEKVIIELMLVHFKAFYKASKLRFDSDPEFKLRAQQAVVSLQVKTYVKIFLFLPVICEILGNLVLNFIYVLSLISEWRNQVSQGMATNL